MDIYIYVGLTPNFIFCRFYRRCAHARICGAIPSSYRINPIYVYLYINTYAYRGRCMVRYISVSVDPPPPKRISQVR